MSEKKNLKAENGSQGSGMIRVLVVDGDPVWRNSIKRILEEDERIFVCGSAANGKEAWKLCVREKPDVVLMDVQLPDTTGEIIIQIIKKALPETGVVIFTDLKDRETVEAAIISGARSYILKDADPEHLPDIIECYMAELYMFSDEGDCLANRVNGNNLQYNLKGDEPLCHG